MRKLLSLPTWVLCTALFALGFAEIVIVFKLLEWCKVAETWEGDIAVVLAMGLGGMAGLVCVLRQEYPLTPHWYIRGRRAVVLGIWLMLFCWGGGLFLLWNLLIHYPT